MYHNRIDQTSKWHPISISVLFFYNLITYTQHQSPNSIILGTHKAKNKKDCYILFISVYFSVIKKERDKMTRSSTHAHIK